MNNIINMSVVDSPSKGSGKGFVRGEVVAIEGRVQLY